MREPIEAVLRVRGSDDLYVQRAGGLDEEVPKLGLDRPVDAVLNLVDEEEASFRDDEMKAKRKQPRHALSERAEGNRPRRPAQQDLRDGGAAALGDRDAIDRGLYEAKRRNNSLLVGGQDDFRPEPGERRREEAIGRHEPDRGPQAEAEAIGHGREAGAEQPLSGEREDGDPATFSGLFERDLEATGDEGRRGRIDRYSLDCARHAELAIPGGVDTKRRALLQTVTPEPVAEIDLHRVSASSPKFPALERRPVEDERALRGRDGLESLKQRRFARIVRSDDQAHPRQPVDPQLLEAAEVFDLERGDRGH